MLTIEDWERFKEQAHKKLMSPLPAKETVSESTQSINRVRLVEFLHASFDLEEFKSLCFRLDEKYDDLCRETLKGKIEELVEKFERKGRITALIGQAKSLRPNVLWDDVYFSQK